MLRWGGKLAAHPSVLGHGGRRDAAAWRSLGLAPRHSASVYLPALTPAAGRPLTTRAAAGRRGAEARRVGASRRHLLPELLPSARARTSATHPGHAALAARREAALACQWHRAPGSPLSEVQGFIPASAGNHAQGPPAAPRWGGAAQVPRHVGPRSLPFLPRPPHLEAANSVVMTGSARRDFEHKNHARTFENPDAQAALWSIKSEFLRWKGAQVSAFKKFPRCFQSTVLRLGNLVLEGRQVEASMGSGSQVMPLQPAAQGTGAELSCGV